MSEAPSIAKQWANKKNLRHSGANPSQTLYPQGFGWANNNGENTGEEKMAKKQQKKTKDTTSLRHYTSIESICKILDNGFLLLSDPEKWEDKNDTAALLAFGKLKGENVNVRALCLLDGKESIYHWERYAAEGGCIIFDKEAIIKNAETQKLLHDSVVYKDTINTGDLNLENKIPFLKRSQYQCEGEYRIIWHGKGFAEQIHFEKEAVKCIRLSPKIDDAKRAKLKSELEKKYKVRVEFSRVLEAEDWINVFRRRGNENKRRSKST
ncbi:MAG: hypothetical protein FWC15_02230 [Fibromonadales bacterium]|nr:hypothetical protein [Fibromonadales bacterium]